MTLPTLSKKRRRDARKPDTGWIILHCGNVVAYRIKVSDIQSYGEHRFNGTLVKVKWSREALLVDETMDEISKKILAA